MSPATLALTYRQNTTDPGTVRDIFERGAYSLEPLRRNAELLAFRAARAACGMRPLIVDAGANIGAASVYFHREFPDATIVAVEPEADNFSILAANALARPIICHNRAVTSRPVAVRVVDPGLGSNAFRTETHGERVADGHVVEGITINQIFLDRPEDTYPFIVKIDIEGAEEELFSGNTEWLNDTPLLIIELHDWLFPNRTVSRNFLKSIADLHRDFVHIGESIFSIATPLDSRDGRRRGA
jgi:FkbM family methyltransferase